MNISTIFEIHPDFYFIIFLNKNECFSHFFIFYFYSGKITVMKNFFKYFFQIIEAELFPSFVYGDVKHRMPHKIILRSKRQSCICISVFPSKKSRIISSSNFQCSCDSTNQQIGHSQQQRELQKELSQFQQSPTQNSQCGCQLNSDQSTTVEDPMTTWASNYGKFLGHSVAAKSSPITVDANGSPIYDCQCVQVCFYLKNRLSSVFRLVKHYNRHLFQQRLPFQSFLRHLRRPFLQLQYTRSLFHNVNVSKSS